MKPMTINGRKIIEERCPCCGGIATVGTNNLMSSVRCESHNCHLKVERGLFNSRTQSKAEAMCLRVWRKRPKLDPLQPRPLPIEYVIPSWAKWIACDSNGDWHVYDVKPELDHSINGWVSPAGRGRSQFVMKSAPNDSWWRTLQSAPEMKSRLCLRAGK